MKKTKFSLLALAAIIGAGSAFTSRRNASKSQYIYGITGLTVNGHGYVIVPFSFMDHSCSGSVETCSITSATARISPTATNASGIRKYPGRYESK